MRHLAALTLLATAVIAQDIVVPASCSTADGRSNGALAGFTQRFRMQVLLRASRLTALQNRELTGFVVRRDGQNPEALQGGRTYLVVRLSTLGVGQAAPSPVFAHNEGNDVREVFRGMITIPDAPALAHRDAATWQSPHAVAVDFTAPFPYLGGTLCLDIEGSPDAMQPARWWPIDFDLATHDAQVAQLGSSCNPRAQALCSPSDLLPGGSVRLIGIGRERTLAGLMLGARQATPPLSLDGIGATGCVAHLLPDVTLGNTYSGAPSAGMAAACAHLHLPNLPSLANATLYAQWLAYPDPINPAQLSTTAGLALQMASATTQLSGVVVRTGPLSGTAPTPGDGRVLPQIVPVLCLRHR